MAIGERAGPTGANPMAAPSAQRPLSRRTAFRGSLLVLAAATALTLVAAWPVIGHPAERVFGEETVGRHHDPFTVMRQFAGAPVDLQYLQPATDWVGRALATVMPPVAAYNLLVLLTFPLAAWFAYLFAYEITGSKAGSAVAGLAFAFAPFHVAHAAYHPHVAQVQWIPLYFFALWRCVHGLTPRRAVGLVTAASLAVLSNDYNALLLAAMTPFAAPLFWLIPSRDGEKANLRDLACTLGMLAAAAAAVLLSVHQAVPAAFSKNVAASYGDLFLYGARWWSYLVPPVDHPVVGPWARQLWAEDGIASGLLEQQVYIGWGVLALAGVAAVTSWRLPLGARRVACLLALAAIAGLCSLAPTLSRPSTLLHTLLPMFRAYARFAVIVQLLLSVIAGIGIAALWRTRWARTAAIIALVVLAFEYAPLPARWRDALPTSAHRWLVQRRNRSPVFDCTPPSPGEVHTAWLAGYAIGYLGRVVPDCGEPGLPSKLRTMGYRYVVVRRDTPERQFLDDSPRAGLTRIHRAEDADVLAITAPADPWLLIDSHGIYPREYTNGHTWRWAGSSSTIALVNTAANAISGTLEIRLAAFACPRHVTMSVDREVQVHVVVALHPATFVLGPLTLSPGRHELAIESAEPAVTPASTSGGADARPLAIGIFDWTVSTVGPPATPR
jgi:hypothetical protein